MTSEEARSLGRAIRSVRTERGLTQVQFAVDPGVGSSFVRVVEYGHRPASQGRPGELYEVGRDLLEQIAAALGCTPELIANRAALSATTRVLYGLEPLGPARTVVAGFEYDLTETEAGRVADFIAGLLAARDQD